MRNNPKRGPKKKKNKGELITPHHSFRKELYRIRKRLKHTPKINLSGALPKMNITQDLTFYQSKKSNPHQNPHHQNQKIKKSYTLIIHPGN